MKTKRRQIPKKNRELIINRDGRKCFYCNSTERLTVDHIVPLKHGGSNLASNMITSCHSCNSTKNGNRLLDRFNDETLSVACARNVECGIPQDMDIVAKTGRRIKTNSVYLKMIGAKQGDFYGTGLNRKSVGRIISRVDEAASHGKLFFGIANSLKEMDVIQRNTKKNRIRYLSIPIDTSNKKLVIFEKMIKGAAIVDTENLKQLILALRWVEVNGRITGKLGL